MSSFTQDPGKRICRFFKAVFPRASLIFTMLPWQHCRSNVRPLATGSCLVVSTFLATQPWLKLPWPWFGHKTPTKLSAFPTGANLAWRYSQVLICTFPLPGKYYYQQEILVPGHRLRNTTLRILPTQPYATRALLTQTFLMTTLRL